MSKKDVKAPQWGTMEWIAAYPYSDMDRKRKARVRKALGAEFDEIDKGPRPCCAVRRLTEIAQRYHVTLPVKDLKRFASALDTMMVYDTAVRNEAIGRALAKKWGLD